MIGAISIIRFRTTFKNPKDIIFMFLTLGIGIACRVYAFNIAIIGSVAFNIIAIILSFSSIGSIERFDGIVTSHLIDI